MQNSKIYSDFKTRQGGRGQGAVGGVAMVCVVEEGEEQLSRRGSPKCNLAFDILLSTAS